MDFILVYFTSSKIISLIDKLLNKNFYFLSFLHKLEKKGKRDSMIGPVMKN
ncbi:hypothetical protein wVul_0955 [Wolbachia endosymbiont of Armadillidium vulgare str. wVulC]|nr:hypothetical protein wVul_0955 [Wolbachia endosymbiont of Armadillidium vulgare str. wVulC]